MVACCKNAYKFFISSAYVKWRIVFASSDFLSFYLLCPKFTEHVINKSQRNWFILRLPIFTSTDLSLLHYVSSFVSNRLLSYMRGYEWQVDKAYRCILRDRRAEEGENRRNRRMINWRLVKTTFTAKVGAIAASVPMATFHSPPPIPTPMNITDHINAQ